MSWLRAEDLAGHGCVRAVEEAGGEPLPLRVEADSWRATFPALDGLISTVEHEHETEGERSRFHPVTVLPATRLAAIAGLDGPLQVNSRHHQGLVPTQLAPGLRLSAIAPDGVVEGLETSNEEFVLGIQFHPEMPGEVRPLAPIFDVLVARARDR